MNTFLLFPVHLYPLNLLREKLSKASKIILIEHPVYFKRYSFHKLKLVYHRASMKLYAETLSEAFQGSKIHYIEAHNYEEEMKKLILPKSKLTFFDPVDHELSDLMAALATETGSSMEKLDSLGYLCTREDLEDYVNEYLTLPNEPPNKKKKANGTYERGQQRKKYTHDSSFYRWQRRRLNVLMPKNGRDPSNWTFDSENRKTYKEASAQHPNVQKTKAF
jgi:deoxyribodipyrimidine photolyase-related protein